jgi:hypothetical protein
MTSQTTTRESPSTTSVDLGFRTKRGAISPAIDVFSLSMFFFSNKRAH